MVVVDVARPALSGWRLFAATWTPVLLLAGVWAIQWYVTSPGETTYVEFRLMLLACGVALPITLSARWIDAAERKIDTRRDRHG